MPDRGRLESSRVGSLESVRGTWSEACWLQLTFEVPREAALTWLPNEATRPIPGYARIFVLAPASGTGDGGGIAALLAGGRLRDRPVNALVASALGVSLVAGAGEVIASAREGALPFLQVRLEALSPVDPKLLHWDPWLVSAIDQGGDERLVELKAGADIRGAWRSRTARVELGTQLSPESPWRELRNSNTISACYCTGSFGLGPALAGAAGGALER